MWSALVVRYLKIDHTQRHLSALREPEAHNSAVGWHWNKQANNLFIIRVYNYLGNYELPFWNHSKCFSPYCLTYLQFYCLTLTKYMCLVDALIFYLSCATVYEPHYTGC